MMRIFFKSQVGRESELVPGLNSFFDQVWNSNQFKAYIYRILVFKPDSFEIVDAIESVEMYLAHNSAHMRKAPSYPLIAPVVLEQMSLVGFAANSAEFNRSIGSDKHVYFFAAFKRKSDPSIAIRSEYGGKGVVLKTEAAKRLAFVSPFILYKEHLADVAQSIDPELSRRYIGFHF